jgi:hypothetical protein
MTELRMRMSEEDICDFCSRPNPARRFQCPDFSLDKRLGYKELRSKGDWLACTGCGSLIDAGKWDALLLRALSEFAEKYSAMPRRILTDTIKRSHDLFRENYQKVQS